MLLGFLVIVVAVLLWQEYKNDRRNEFLRNRSISLEK